MSHTWKNSAYQDAWTEIELAYNSVRELKTGDYTFDDRINYALDDLDNAEALLEQLDDDYISVD